MLFFLMAVLFNLLGYWVRGGHEILNFFVGKSFTYFKVGFVGMLAAVPLWFFYYR